MVESEMKENPSMKFGGSVIDQIALNQQAQLRKQTESSLFQPPQNQKRDRIVFLLYILLFVAITIADYFYQDSLFELNLDVIPGWQQTFSDSTITYFKIITLCGYGAVGVVFFFIAFTFFSREKAFYLLFVHTVESLYNQEIKMLYKAQRPYFVPNRGMQIFGSCAMTYGNPSGHASFSAAIYTTLFLLIFHDKDHTINQRLQYQFNRDSGSNSVVMDDSDKSEYREIGKNKLLYALGVLLTAFMVVNIGVSRFMLGAHSFDQVLYGWTYGLWFAFFLFKYARPIIQRHIRRLLETNTKEFAIHYQAAVRSQALWHIIIALGVWIAIIITSGLIYYFTSQGFVYPQDWIKAIIQCNGGEAGLTPNKMFTNVAFISTGGASSIFGAYFGIILDSMYLKGTPQDINANSTFLKGIARLLISLIIVSPLLIPYLLINDYAPMMVIYLFKQTVPFFLIMLCLFSVVKLAHVRLRLVSLKAMSHLSS